ncbi:MAG: hypothetical protein AB7R90_10985 [Reyranellaceae bacterium]
MKPVIMLLVLVLAGCATARSTVVAPDVAMISGRGTKFNDQGQVVRAAMRSAARTTLDKGYQYFTILDSKDMSQTGATIMPGQTYTTTTGTASISNYGQASFSTRSRTHSTPGYVTPYIKPGVDFMIRMFRHGQVTSDTAGIFDAKEILTVTK